MDKIEKIRKEIERRIALYSRLSEYNIDPNRIDEDEQLLAFIDSLEDERTDYTNFTQKEVHSQGYDEAYLNDCIARAKKSWEGVDVDKYMDMVRGGEPVDKSLEEAADNFAHCYDQGSCDGIAQSCFIAGGKWKEEQMMEDAVEGEIVKDISNKLVVTAKINLDGFKFGDKVKVIVIKED